MLPVTNQSKIQMIHNLALFVRRLLKLQDQKWAKNYRKNQQHQHMKRDKINDDPSESDSPLDQTTESSHRNPFPNMENLRYSYPRSFYDRPRPSKAQPPTCQDTSSSEASTFRHLSEVDRGTVNHQQTWHGGTWLRQVKDRGHPEDKISSQSAP